MPRPRDTLVLCLATLIVACGSNPGPDGLPRPATSMEGLEGRRCDYVAAPAELPSFEALARPGTRGSIALWGREMADSDSVQLSVRYGDDGRLQWVQALGSTLDPERTRALERLIVSALPETAEPDWGIRVLVRGGDLADLRPSVICEAEVDRSARAGLLPVPATPSGQLALYQLRGQRFHVSIRLDSQGRIMDVRFAQRSGNSEVDQFLMDIVRQARFKPKLHDGLGVATTVQEAVVIPRRS